MDTIRLCYRVVLDAFYRFNADDGWAIASHIALSILMALFPFLILVTAIAGFVGSRNLADEVARLIVATWPRQVSASIAGEIHDVLTSARGDILTLGVVFAVYFASSGIESLRIGLNRAYGLNEARAWWLLRLESIGYVLVSAISLLAMAFLVVLGPLLFKAALAYAPWLDPLEGHYDIARFGVAAVVLAIAVTILHMWLPAGRRPMRVVSPAILALALVAPPSASAGQQTGDRSVVILSPAQDDARLALTREAITFWNQTFSDLMLRPRLVEAGVLVASPITRVLETYARGISMSNA